MTPAQLPQASTIAPSDNSTSTVLKVEDEPQIQFGATKLRSWSDVVYVDGEHELKMDILAPDSGDPKPLVVYVSGGGFMVSLKDASQDLRTYVAESGFVVASIDYRAMVAFPGTTYVDTIQDVKTAVRFLRANAEKYGINPAKVGVWGESAGGYLAAMAGTTSGKFDGGDFSEQSSDVQAVVDYFGGSDLSRIAADFDDQMKAFYEGPGSFVSAYLNGKPGAGTAPAEIVADANPIEYIGANTPPFLLFHGSADRLISPSQTGILHQALLDAGITSERYVIDGAGHGDLAFLGDPLAGKPWSTPTIMDLVTRFLHTHLDAQN
jgi:acetyl esterase/lipase